MAWRWQSISAGVVKSSTWWTVRTTGMPAPASRTRAAARAAMQSWAWKTSNRPASADRPASRASTDWNTRSSSVSAAAGAGTMVNGAATGRKNPLSGSPRATTVTSARAAVSASARASVWTTPPRGLVE